MLPGDSRIITFCLTETFRQDTKRLIESPLFSYFSWNSKHKPDVVGDTEARRAPSSPGIGLYETELFPASCLRQPLSK